MDFTRGFRFCNWQRSAGALAAFNAFSQFHSAVEFKLRGLYSRFVRSTITCIALLLVSLVISAQAESAKIVKVLPHFLDLQGRNALNPSLFDRDAYQAKLRGSPEERSALRFDVQWKARGYDDLTLRIEARGGTARQPQAITLERKVKGRFFSRWTALKIEGEEYKRFGEMISWRASLWSGTNQVAEQKSFLW